MAQLVTTKEKYGVSVASRIDPEIAHQISDRAERLGISFAKMVGMLIVSGFNPAEPIYLENSEEIDRLESEVEGLNFEVSELHEKLADLKSLYQRTAGRFITEIATDVVEQREFSEAYNTILHQLKAEKT
ncbi:MAG: hypothetical protein KBF73_03300 [Flavobacteriales bacterium]|nr:hypothetical protein [Flavobacteriales bacterium]